MLYRAKQDEDEGVFKCGKIGQETPLGYEKTRDFFVDNSGFGTRGEMALVLDDFLKVVKKGYFYGITSCGQFQVYIWEFKKLKVTRKELHDINGIKTSKKITNNTRYTEYLDGRRVLRLHNTDIITWTAEGKIILNSGGYRTHTTKNRLHRYINIYQKNYNWYIRQEGKPDIEFFDGIEL